jgi:hypothetical protein
MANQEEKQKLDNLEEERRKAKDETARLELMQKNGDAKPDAAPAVPDA